MEVLGDKDTASGFKQGGGRHPKTPTADRSFCVAGEGSDTCPFRPPTDHQTASPVELEEGLRPPDNPHHQAVGALL